MSEFAAVTVNFVVPVTVNNPGPLMGPAYLGCSLGLWLMHRRPYRDNPFERQAYEEGGGE